MPFLFTWLIITASNILVESLIGVESGVASFTYYTSYAACCKNNPNYDPTADTSECDDYSACDYSGEFAAIGHQSFDYVKTHNLIAFYDSSDPNGDTFDSNYGGKAITLTKGGVTIEAIIADTCADTDCDGCCTTNAQPSGYLVDMEYWTVINNFGSVDDVDGQINFSIEDGIRTTAVTQVVTTKDSTQTTTTTNAHTTSATHGGTTKDNTQTTAATHAGTTIVTNSGSTIVTNAGTTMTTNAGTTSATHLGTTSSTHLGTTGEAANAADNDSDDKNKNVWIYVIVSVVAVLVLIVVIVFVVRSKGKNGTQSQTNQHQFSLLADNDNEL